MDGYLQKPFDIALERASRNRYDSGTLVPFAALRKRGAFHEWLADQH